MRAFKTPISANDPYKVLVVTLVSVLLLIALGVLLFYMLT